MLFFQPIGTAPKYSRSFNNAGLYGGTGIKYALARTSLSTVLNFDAVLLRGESFFPPRGRSNGSKFAKRRIATVNIAIARETPGPG